MHTKLFFFMLSNDKFSFVSSLNRVSLDLVFFNLLDNFEKVFKHTNSFSESVFTIRVNDVDWLIKYDGENYKTYTAFQEYYDNGYTLDEADNCVFLSKRVKIGV